MKVVEMFKSIDGEGVRAGALVSFIRLFGCNLNCSYCDTSYGCSGEDYQVNSVEEIVRWCCNTAYKKITVTGGEPMVHPGIGLLLHELVLHGFEVNVETNGTKQPIHFPEEGKKEYGRVFYTMDYKCPCSGMEEHMDVEILKQLSADDVLKFVVASEDDLDRALEVIEEVHPVAQVFFSPVFGKIAPLKIVAWMQRHRLTGNYKVQLQLHKLIWSPDERGV